MTAKDLQTRLRSLGNPKDAAFLAGFFKTGPGQYGEGDVFIGVRVPVTRKVAKDFKNLPLPEVECLLHSPIHEERLAALVILVMQAAKADAKTRKAIYGLYLANTEFINNWDLVDLSAPQIVGVYLADKSRKPLYRLAKSSWLGSPDQHPGNIPFHPAGRLRRHARDCGDVAGRPRRPDAQGGGLDASRSRQAGCGRAGRFPRTALPGDAQDHVAVRHREAFGNETTGIDGKEIPMKKNWGEISIRWRSCSAHVPRSRAKSSGKGNDDLARSAACPPTSQGRHAEEMISGHSMAGLCVCPCQRFTRHVTMAGP